MLFDCGVLTECLHPINLIDHTQYDSTLSLRCDDFVFVVRHPNRDGTNRGYVTDGKRRIERAACTNGSSAFAIRNLIE
jgi:hypothetical protein